MVAVVAGNLPGTGSAGAHRMPDALGRTVFPCKGSRLKRLNEIRHGSKPSRRRPHVRCDIHETLSIESFRSDNHLRKALQRLIPIVLSVILLCGSLAPAWSADDLPKPKGEVILTVSGKIARTPKRRLLGDCPRIGPGPALHLFSPALIN